MSAFLKPSARSSRMNQNLIIVAAVKNVLHFRIFDAIGTPVVETEEKRLTEQAGQIADLRQQLESLWPPHEMTTSDKRRVIRAVASIVNHPCHETPTPTAILVPSWSLETYYPRLHVEHLGKPVKDNDRRDIPGELWV